MDEHEVIPAEESNSAETAESQDSAEVASTEADVKQNAKKNRPLIHEFYEYIVDILVTSVVAAVFLLTLIVRTGYVDGASMAPTMLDGDRYLVSGLFYTPEQGDIIVFQPEDNAATRRYVHGENKLLVKRVIATEGQVVDIDDETHQVLVDGVVLNESYLPGNITDKKTDSSVVYPFEVPPGHIFVMGDNRRESVDSRQLGSVDVRTILGKVFVRFFPFDKIGAIN